MEVTLNACVSRKPHHPTVKHSARIARVVLARRFQFNEKGKEHIPATFFSTFLFSEVVFARVKCQAGQCLRCLSSQGPVQQGYNDDDDDDDDNDNDNKSKSDSYFSFDRFLFVHSLHSKSP